MATEREKLDESVMLTIVVRDAGLLRAIDSMVARWAKDGKIDLAGPNSIRLTRAREAAVTVLLEQVAEREGW